MSKKLLTYENKLLTTSENEAYSVDIKDNSDVALDFALGVYSGPIVDTLGSITTLYAYQFANQSQITKAVFPQCSRFLASSIYSGSRYSSTYGETFARCYSLSEVVMPLFYFTSTYQVNTFSSCLKLEKVNINGSQITYIPSNTFYNCKKLSMLNSMPNCSSVYSYGFCDCYNIPNEFFENLGANLSSMSLGTYAFSGCKKLTNVYPIFSRISTWIAEGAFYNTGVEGILNLTNQNSINFKAYANTNISELNVYNAYYITSSAFESCKNLISANFYKSNAIQNYLQVGSFAFNSCTSLKNIYFDEEFEQIRFADSCFQNTGLEKLSANNIYSLTNNRIFQSCSSLGYINLPNCSLISYAEFSSCINMSYAYIPKISSIQDNAFYNCYNLESVYLMQESGLTNVPNLINSRVFFGAGKSVSEGIKFYVGYDEYVSMLKSATNWIYYSNRIFVSRFNEEV